MRTCIRQNGDAISKFQEVELNVGLTQGVKYLFPKR